MYKIKPKTLCSLCVLNWVNIDFISFSFHLVIFTKKYFLNCTQLLITQVQNLIQIFIHFIYFIKYVSTFNKMCTFCADVSCNMFMFCTYLINLFCIGCVLVILNNHILSRVHFFQNIDSALLIYCSVIFHIFSSKVFCWWNNIKKNIF